MKRKRPETYEAEVGGRKVRVTVPDAIDEEVLFDAIKDNLSPQAVAAIVAFLQSQRYGPLNPDEPTASAEVNAQVAWFVERLAEMVGGDEQVKQLLEEVGL